MVVNALGKSSEGNRSVGQDADVGILNSWSLKTSLRE